MLKFLLYISLTIITVLNASKVEIYAPSLSSEKGIVHIDGGIAVTYEEYLLTANRAVYNKGTGDLELFDNIRATYKDNYRILGNYAKLNIKKKEKIFKPFYMLEKSSNVWISGDEGCSQDKDIQIKAGIISGCNQNNPLWKMEFSSSDYNSDSKWINLYNTTLYIYDIPILYTPYFGYSLDLRRRTGLLFPSISASDKEGFYYQQPLYIAPQDKWDLEIKPQIRTNRGYGIYSKLRFVDSKISSGSLQMGYFKEYLRYSSTEKLVNNKHYGFNFNYKNSDFLKQWINKDIHGQSGLYVDVKSMNDVDYINLEKNDNINTNTATKILSRINLFYNTDSNYIATYFKYYQDLTQNSNSNTLQKLPTLHYHHYLDTFLEKYLSYNIDIKSTNIQRIINKKVVQTDINIPITLKTSLFNEMVNISYQGNFYGQDSHFSGKEERVDSIVNGYNDGYFLRNYHTFTLSTELTRRFEDFIHVLSFSTQYTFGGKEARGGYYKDKKEFCLDPANAGIGECEFYNITDIDEDLEFDFTQYFYDLTGKRVLYHRLAQRILYVNNKSQYGELENELEYEISDNLTLYNNMFYNFDKVALSKLFNQITLHKDNMSFSLAHLYKNYFNNSSPHISYLTFNAQYIYNEHYSYNFRYDTDLKTKVNKSREIGFLYQKRCWDFGLKYVDANTPKLTQDGASSTYEKKIYFTIILKPIMSSNTNSSYGISLPDRW